MQLRGLFVYAFVVLAVILVAASMVAEAAQPVNAPPVPRLGFNVSKAVLELLVYPDGSVQPRYSLRASMSLGDTDVSGSLSLSSMGMYTGNASKSEATANVSIRGLDIDKAVTLSLEVMHRYQFKGGNGHAVLTAVAEYAENGHRYSLKLDELSIDLVDGKNAVVSIQVTLSKELLEKLIEESKEKGGKLPTVDEINKKLSENGFGYIRVKEIEYADIEGGAKKLRAKIVIDIDGMLRAARANGLSEKDAEALKKLLTAPYRVEGRGRLSLSLKTVPGEKHAYLSLTYEASSRGDLEKMQRLLRSSSGSINALVRALLQPLLAKNPQAAIAIAQAERQAGAGSMFLTAPGSQSRLELKARIEKGRAEISLDYTGERIYIPASSPSTVAEKTLTALALQYQRLASSLGQLALIFPGITQAVPLKAKLVPAEPCVKLGRTEATITQLPSVKVDLSACSQRKTTTLPRTTSSATQTTTQASPATTLTPATTTTSTTPAKQTSTPPTPSATTRGTAASTPTSPATSQATVTAAKTEGGGIGQAGLAAAAAILAIVALAAGLALRRH